MSGFDPPPRMVKPRKRVYQYRPVIAINKGRYLREDGSTGDASIFKDTLYGIQPTLFVCQNSADWVADLDSYFESWGDTWQWRASTKERDMVRPGGIRLGGRMSTVIHYFGFKSVDRKGHSLYHKVIDPIAMYGRELNKVWPEGGSVIERLLAWGVAIRDFCDDNDIEVRPTIGSMGAQFLTDERFYPEARRKVPAKINARVREELPGNHYQLFTEPTPDSDFSAWYLDQSGAHHYHAQIESLPDANTLHAFGNFLRLDSIAFQKITPNFYGLYCLEIEAPKWKYQRRLTWLPKDGKQFVFSNEIPYLVNTGYKIHGVYAAWGSLHKDEGIPRYGKWASQYLAEAKTKGDVGWLKPILLSTYGVLATRPQYGEAVFKQARKGERVTVLTGRNKLSGTAVKRSMKLEPGVANVLHRGMIEAATRVESISFAQWLLYQNFTILSIYADAVIVLDEGERDLPELIPEPWRLQTKLNHLQFVNQQAFISGELTKLPGMPGREILKYGKPSRHSKPKLAPLGAKYDQFKNVRQTHGI